MATECFSLSSWRMRTARRSLHPRTFGLMAAPRAAYAACKHGAVARWQAGGRDNSDTNNGSWRRQRHSTRRAFAAWRGLTKRRAVRRRLLRVGGEKRAAPRRLRPARVAPSNANLFAIALPHARRLLLTIAVLLRCLRKFAMPIPPGPPSPQTQPHDLCLTGGSRFLTCHRRATSSGGQQEAVKKRSGFF